MANDENIGQGGRDRNGEDKSREDRGEPSGRSAFRGREAGGFDGRFEGDRHGRDYDDTSRPSPEPRDDDEDRERDRGAYPGDDRLPAGPGDVKSSRSDRSPRSRRPDRDEHRHGRPREKDLGRGRPDWSASEFGSEERPDPEQRREDWSDRRRGNDFERF